MSKIDNENVENIISNADSYGKEERNVPDLRFKEDEQWTSKKLDEIASFYKGNGLSKEDISSEGNYCILYGQLYTTYKSEIIDNVVSKTKKIPINAFYSLSNDIIIPSSGEKPEDIAKACCITSDGILIGGDLNVIRAYNHNGGFLSYQLNGKRKCEIARLAQGKSIVHLHNSDIKNIKISYPINKDIEIKICNFLFEVDKRIKTQKKIIELHKSLIISIKNREFYNLKRSNCKLENVLIEINKKTTIKNQHEILSSTVEGIVKQSDYFDRQVASENNVGYKIVERGNIIISPQNLWMGNISYNDKFDIGIVSPSYRIFSINSEYNSQYIFEMLRTKKSLYLFKTVSKQGASIVRRNLNYEAFLQLTFHIPNINNQNTFIEKLVSLQNKLSIEKQILELLEKQKQYLLQKLFI